MDVGLHLRYMPVIPKYTVYERALYFNSSFLPLTYFRFNTSRWMSHAFLRMAAVALFL